MAKDVISQNTEEFKVVIDADKRPSGEHARRFNAPSCNEVGVLTVGEEHGKRDIVLRYNDRRLERVDETHRSYDPLQYPMIFPRGEDGYCFSHRMVGGRKLSSMKFYAFRLMIRPETDFNTLHRYRRLTQQFFVDMYVKVDAERLRFIKAKQKELRADSYAEFTDALSRG